MHGILVKPAGLVDLTKKPGWKKALAESLAQAEAGQGHFFASNAEFISFLEKKSKKARGKGGKK